MLKNICLLLLTLLLNRIDAQKNHDVKLEKVQKEPSKGAFWADEKYSYYSIFRDVNGKKNSVCAIEKADTSLTRSKVVDLNVVNTADIKGLGDDYKFFYIGNNFLIVHTVLTRPKTYTYFTLYDWKGVQKARKEVVDPIGSVSSYEFKMSEDRNLLLCYTIGFDDSKLHLLVLNQNLDEKCKTSIEIKDIIDKHFYDYSISNSGNFYCTYSQYVKGKVNYLRLLSVSGNGSVVKEFPLLHDGFPIESSVFKLKGDDQIYVSGYLARNSKGPTDVLHMSLNGKDFSINYKSCKPLSKEFITKLTPESVANSNKPKALISIPSFRSIHPKDDGGYIAFRIIDDMIVMTNVSNKGDEIWSSYIPKGNFLHVGYIHSLDVAYLYADGKYYILYSDDAHNINALRRGETIEFDFQEACIFLATISEGGEFTREIVYKPQLTREDQRLFFRPTLANSYIEGQLQIIRANDPHSQSGYLKVK